MTGANTGADLRPDIADRSRPGEERPRLLALLVVVPDGADPGPWIKVRDGLSSDGVLILAYPLGASALATGSGIEIVHSSAGASIFHLWGAAIPRTAATYLAVVDARCPPGAEWLDGARRAIVEGIPAFFGPVTISPSADGQALVEYLLEYGQFARPIAEGMHEVPGNNLVFRRDLLDLADLRDEQFHKVFFVDRLQREGKAPVYRDDVEVRYAKRYLRLHYLKRRFAHGRTYAALRASGKSVGFRIWRAVSSPALPLLRLARIARSLRGKPALQAGLRRYPIYALAAETAWSLGECAGYLSGTPGDPVYLN